MPYLRVGKLKMGLMKIIKGNEIPMQRLNVLISVGGIILSISTRYTDYWR